MNLTTGKTIGRQLIMGLKVMRDEGISTNYLDTGLTDFRYFWCHMQFIYAGIQEAGMESTYYECNIDVKLLFVSYGIGCL